MRAAVACALLLVALAAVWIGFAGAPTATVALPVPEAPRTAPAPTALAPSDPEVGDARAPQASEPRRDPVPADAPEAPVPEETEAIPFHGVVVDRRTGEPVPLLTIKAGERIEATDADGRFGDRNLPVVDVAAFDVLTARNYVERVPLDELEPLAGGGWRVPIEIGPTYHVQIVGAGEIDPSEWQVGLVESASEREDRGWGWRLFEPGEGTWLRYEDAKWEPHPDFAPRLLVRRADNTRSGEAPVESTVGIHPGIVVIEVSDELGLLRGRVVDELGQPLRNTRVMAVPADGTLEPTNPRGWVSDSTNAAGEYGLPRLRPGTWWLNARPRDGRDALVQVVLVPSGRSSAPDFVFPVQVAAGSIRGRLDLGAGTDFKDSVVRLRARDGRSFDRLVDVRARGEVVNFSRGALRMGEPFAFKFEDVPAGDYELSVVPFDGSSWVPNSLRISPPANDLVFTRMDTPTEELVFRVTDAESGAPIKEVFTQFHSPPIWYPGATRHRPGEPLVVKLDGAFRWNLHAPGYALASGDQDDFEPRGAGRREAVVHLERGWGARLLLRDNLGLFGNFDTDRWAVFLEVAGRPPLARAKLFADGEQVGVSDADGLVELRLEQEPARIEVRKPGWRTLGSGHFVNGRLVGHPREVVVWMTRLGAR
jgi:hypothetical protein